MIRVVVDTNVWISALLARGFPRKVVDHFETGSFLLVYPNYLLEELARVPLKARLGNRISSQQLSTLIGLVKHLGNAVDIQEIATVSRDPFDDVFLACAERAKADYLVTGGCAPISASCDFLCRRIRRTRHTSSCSAW